MTEKNNVVPVSDMDYLEEDETIRGQSFVCLSFLSPEKILEKKEIFTFTKFTENFSKDVTELFENLKLKYPDDEDGFQTITDRYRFLFNKKHMQEEYTYYLDEKSEELNNEFNREVDFKTNVRGFKVRGSYDTLREAQVRSEVLKRKDNKHNIYIAQVGCWCPWDPAPNDIQDQHYGEDQLNTLMKKYRENQSYKDQVFSDRKDELVDKQKKKTDLASLQNLSLEDNDENLVLEPGEGLTEEEKMDVVTNSGVGGDQTVKENVNEDSKVDSGVFESEDPWMKKQQE
jgi:hypothetical protein